MKCISLWQPWASAIALGYKRIETRDWSTNVRGRIAIHAAKRWTSAERLFLDKQRALGRFPQTATLPLGAVVCTALLIDVRSTSSLIAAGISPMEGEFGNYLPGRYGWLLQDVRPLLAPIPFLGAQGFFDVPDDLFTSDQRRAPPAAQADLFARA
jgi:hypothetical protein